MHLPVSLLLWLWIAGGFTCGWTHAKVVRDQKNIKSIAPVVWPSMRWKEGAAHTSRYISVLSAGWYIWALLKMISYPRGVKSWRNLALVVCQKVNLSGNKSWATCDFFEKATFKQWKDFNFTELTFGASDNQQTDKNLKTMWTLYIPLGLL